MPKQRMAETPCPTKAEIMCSTLGQKPRLGERIVELQLM